MVGMETMDGRHGNHGWSAWNHGWWARKPWVVGKQTMIEDLHPHCKAFVSICKRLVLQNVVEWTFSVTTLNVSCCRWWSSHPWFHADHSWFPCKPSMVSMPTIHGWHVDHPWLVLWTSVICKQTLRGCHMNNLKHRLQTTNILCWSLLRRSSMMVIMDPICGSAWKCEPNLPGLLEVTNLHVLVLPSCISCILSTRVRITWWRCWSMKNGWTSRSSSMDFLASILVLEIMHDSSSEHGW